MNDKTISLKIEFSVQRIRDLLNCALQAPYSWIKGLNAVECHAFDSLPWLVKTEWEFTDRYGGTLHVLNDSAINRGIRAMLDKCPQHFGNWIAGREDADTGNIFLQCCLFGNVVYC